MEQILGEAGPALMFIGKAVLILFMVIYTIFAFVVVRQVGLMTRTLSLGFEGVIKTFAYLHLLAAIGILVISVVL